MTTSVAGNHQRRADEDAVTTAAIDPHYGDDLISLAEVKRLAGIGKTMIYRLERGGRFPRRYKPGGYASRWSRREVMEWREEQRRGIP